MWNTKRLLTIVLVAKLCLAYNEAPTRRVFYGSNAKIEEFPYYAALTAVHCGAAIISERWVLTAAHCVNRARSPDDYVSVGGESIDNSEIVSYEKVIIHKNYRTYKGTSMHDIALIKLSQPLKFSSKVKPVALPNPASYRGTKAVFVGRGFDETYHISKTIKKLNLTILTTDQCVSYEPVKDHKFYRSLLKEVALCAARRRVSGPTICMGDSGSPLVVNNTLIGLASFGKSACETAQIAYYVNVANYVPWIKSMTKLY